MVAPEVVVFVTTQKLMSWTIWRSLPLPTCGVARGLHILSILRNGFDKEDCVQLGDAAEG
jgi:hypothetical protein